MTVKAKCELIQSVSGFAHNQLSLLDVIKLQSFYKIINIEGPTNKDFLKHVVSEDVWQKIEQMVVFVEGSVRDVIKKIVDYFTSEKTSAFHKQQTDEISIHILSISDLDYYHSSFFEGEEKFIAEKENDYKWLNTKTHRWKKNEFENYLLEKDILNQIAQWDDVYDSLFNSLQFVVRERLLRNFASSTIPMKTNVSEEFDKLSSDIHGFIDAKLVLYGAHEFAHIPIHEENKM
jgi:hypothetical protein